MLGGRRRIEITVSLPSGSVVSELFRLRQKWRALVQCGAGAFLACATHMWAVASEKALPRPSRVRQWVGGACPSRPTPFTGPHRPPRPFPRCLVRSSPPCDTLRGGFFGASHISPTP